MLTAQRPRKCGRLIFRPAALVGNKRGAVQTPA
jgi:hypothetical protein